MVYNNNKLLDYLIFDEGLVYKTSTLYAYEYHLKDHLGNVRVTFQPNGTTTTVKQATEYYPFGMNYAQSPGGTNKYLYNSKEKQDDVLSLTALDLYDYGARFYDPALGRWHSVDPIAEKYFEITPYIYCHNDPINMMDPNGETDYNVSGDGTLIKAHPFVDAVRKFFGVKDDNDKIIAVNRDNKSVILAAGSIGEIKTKDYTDESGKSQNGQFFTVENKSEAVKAYNFLAENTDVEWSQIDSNDKQGAQSTISTSRQNDTEDIGPLLAGEILKSGSNISEITHSHPNSPSIPALGASVVSQEDINNAQYFKNNYPSQKIIFRSYNVRASKYDYYNEKGVYRHEKKNK